MKLLTLKLENFQGLKKEEFKPGGHSASIYGDNATGKTTVFNALTWLLFDKASTGEQRDTHQRQKVQRETFTTWITQQRQHSN